MMKAVPGRATSSEGLVAGRPDLTSLKAFPLLQLLGLEDEKTYTSLNPADVVAMRYALKCLI